MVICGYNCGMKEKDSLNIVFTPGVIHVLRKCYASGSPSEIIGYFLTATQGELAWEHYRSLDRGSRQIYYELTYDLDIAYLLPVTKLQLDSND